MDVNQILCGLLCHVQNQSNYQNLVKHGDTWVIFKICIEILIQRKHLQGCGQQFMVKCS